MPCATRGRSTWCSRTIDSETRVRPSWSRSHASGVVGTGIRPRVTLDVVGWHRITCYADDGRGHNASAYILVSIDVPNYAPVPVIASPLEGASYTTDDDIVFDATGTTDANGDKVLLEITQIGKECHTGCAIFKQVGKCIMPKEGIFARVTNGGYVRAGDEIRIGKNG